jgi:hypothetical protein
MHLFIHSYTYNFSYLQILLKPESWACTENPECTGEFKLSFNSNFYCLSLINFLSILLFTLKEINNHSLLNKLCFVKVFHAPEYRFVADKFKAV